jgi:hypothetical protein
VKPDLDRWGPAPLVHVEHRRETGVSAEVLWSAAQSVRLHDTRALGRLVRLRIPGLTPETSYDAMFRSEPFNVLFEDETALVSGLVGRIWTLRRDYPVLADPEAFRSWSARGTVRVMFASWAEATGAGGAALRNETRVDAVDRAARAGLATLRPLITGSHSLIGREGLEIAVRRAEAGTGSRPAVPGSAASGSSE